jgi:hypothetical protein
MNNNYPQHTQINNRRKQNKNTTTNTTKKKKWTTFTYIGKETRAIAKLFRNTKHKNSI